MDRARDRHAGGVAGAVAAAGMLAAQLLWRVTANDGGVVLSFPEIVATAIARLTPLELFGEITGTYGSLAKRTLLVAVCLGTVAVGARAGGVAGRLAAGGTLRRRLGVILAATAVLLLATLLVIAPVAKLGVLAAGSSYTGDILTQLGLTFALFAVLWALITAPAPARRAAPDGPAAPALVPRRAVFRLGLAAPAAILAVLGVGGSLARMFRPARRPAALLVAGGGTAAGSPAPGTPLTQEQINDRIVATQRAGQRETREATEGGAGDETPVSAVDGDDGREVASLRSDAPETAELAASPPADDPHAPFDALEDAGELTPVLTTTDDFYRVSKNFSDPVVSAEGWALTIDGMVATPLSLTHEQLVARATTRTITTLACISNELNGDLIGTAEWVGVPLAELLAEAGPQPGVVDLKLYAADDYTESFPLAAGQDPDTLVVIGMNGELLRDDHGFPARIIVPGIYGMKNVKWLNRIELVDEDYQGYWQQGGWSDPAPYQIWGRIDTPDGDVDPGPRQACGVASAGDRDVSRVEVSLDNGETWADALLEPSLNPPLTWVRWRFPFEAVAGTKIKLKIRATDGAGTVMDERYRPPLPDGTTGWPRRIFDVRG